MHHFKKITLIIFLYIIGCGSDYNFPETNVNIILPITMPEYNNVYNNLWGYEYLNGGLGGIIIVKGMDDDFIAYDRACTFEINSKCIVSGESSNDPILTCNSCCESQFIIIDGSVTNGPANQALKKYHTYFDGEMLYITN